MRKASFSKRLLKEDCIELKQSVTWNICLFFYVFIFGSFL